ncbi:hypothetical protein [Tengunoibacter tsumagoiensis]|uniref:Uncharacterized protein n=1 Tax=Tengunoibacter tsumagoiensis TaxID=2014871 RepID=A0A402AAB7_9CHLR|nr:hypothetical protein [Tengunoibacter tsumagoiensis]GCE16114.1 hypothetical protein KTT_59730 [Tengunoibacter tsumagoiensis]
MPVKSNIPAFEQALTYAIEQLQSQIGVEIRQFKGSDDDTLRGGLPSRRLPEERKVYQQSTGSLEESAYHLEKIKDWMADDRYFRTVIDTTIYQHVQAAERKQRVRTVVWSLFSLLLGWLLALLTQPVLASFYQSILHIFRMGT